MQTLNWEGIDIAFSHTQPAYCAPYHHLELRAQEPIPVTETGYRSHFISPADLALWDTPEAFVREWLDGASKERDWKNYKSDSRQLSLF